MKKLYFLNETFYWGRSGTRVTVLEMECELTQNVRPDELRAAVLSALRVHRNFRSRPVIVGRQFFVESSDAEKVAVVSEYEGPRSLGTRETEGLTVGVSAASYSYPLWILAASIGTTFA